MIIDRGIVNTKISSRNVVPAVRNFETFKSLDEISSKYKISVERLKILCDNFFLFSFDNEYHLDVSDQILLKFISKNLDLFGVIVDLGSTYFSELRESDPRTKNLFLYEYLNYHNVIDKFVWLIKLNYASKEEIKSKKYRMDTLFQRFLLQNLKRIKSRKAKYSFSKEKITSYLFKGLYNELIASEPFDASYFDIGTNRKGKSNNCYKFAWNVVQRYYSIYEFLNVILLTQQDIDTRSHTKSLSMFSNNFVNTLEKSLLFYPFGLNSRSNGKKDFPKHTQFEYASYPRNLNKNINDLEYDFLETLKARQNKGISSLFDFLYDFRVWANYTGIETIIKVKDGPYLDFLESNLSVMNFFFAGISELFFLSYLGEEEFTISLVKFFTSFVNNHKQFENSLILPVIVRLRIYYYLGIINTDISKLLIKKENDIKFVND
jgi:uncharacterized protein (UPF0332 family)